jgi:threonine dehydrogenase-like Zn-dependent dehydrogenase/GT2 family glycosyltransferase
VRFLVGIEVGQFLGAHLPQLLQALARQRYRDFETIVVDSGSTDRTREIASQAARVLRIDSADFTFGFSLNAGIRAAGGKFIAIVSAHTLPIDAAWLENLVAPLRNDRVAAVYGRQVGLQGVSKFSEIQDLRRTFSKRRELLRPGNLFVNNANAAVRRDLWEMHQFDEHLPGLEDIEWAMNWERQGYEVVYEPTAALYHIHEESWPRVRHRYYREAVARRRMTLSSRRDVPRLILTEALDTLRDLGRAVVRPGERSRPLLSTAKEIAGFRLNKTVGTISGLFDLSAVASLEQRRRYYFDQEYRRVVIRGPGDAALEQVPIPGVKPGDVLIRVAYVGICGTDLEILHGSLGYYATGAAKYPIVPGHEMSGVVAAVGVNVRNFSEGDRVVVECIQGCGSCVSCASGNSIGCPNRSELGVMGRDGGYGEYVLAQERFVHRIPARLDLQTAALAEPLAVVLKGTRRLSRAWPDSPETKRCAVVGCGPIGHLVALVLRQWGHEVVAIDRNPARLKMLELLGEGIQTTQALDAVHGCDAVVEVTGSADVLQRVMQASSPGATLLLLGLPYDRRPFSFEQIVAYDKIVVGSVGSGGEEFAEALQLLPALTVDAFLQHVLPMDRYAEAWSATREGRYLKTMLRVMTKTEEDRPPAGFVEIVGHSSAGVSPSRSGLLGKVQS